MLEITPKFLKSRSLVLANNRLPYNPKLNDRAKELRKNMTRAEKQLWFRFLKNFFPTFLRQRIIDNFIVDFYCSELSLVIELDGESHYVDGAEEYDRERTEILEGYGLKIIRFTNEEIYNNFEGVCKGISLYYINNIYEN